jgi:hypothetical protein
MKTEELFLSNYLQPIFKMDKIEKSSNHQEKSVGQQNISTSHDPKRAKKNRNIWVYSLIVIAVIIAAFLVLKGIRDKEAVWDEAVATTIVTKELNNHSWEKHFTDASTYHKIIAFEEVEYRDVKKMVVMALTFDKNSEPLGIPSVFEFRNKNGWGWKIFRKQIGFGEFMENIKLNMYTNYGGYCIITSRNEAGMGRSWDYSVLYAFTDTRSGFQEIFNTLNDFKFIPNEPTWDIEEIPENGNPETYIFMDSKFVKKSEIFSK